MIKRLRAGLLFFIVLTVQTSNHAPVVSFTQPADHALFTWGSQVPYSVEVSDAEDGESKYQEIQSAEVLVKLRYVGNAVRATTLMKQKKISDTVGIMNMIVSNCFSCHGFKTKIAGPSFQEISKKYPNTPSIQQQLVNHILKGSTGIWGKEVMPTHPELNIELARKMTDWILTYANDPELNYFLGLRSVLPLNKPSPAIHSGYFIVTAFYTDHGTTEYPDKRMTGSAQVMLKMK